MRRRREKRQLEHLAASSDREGTQRAAAAHVKVIEDQPESEQTGAEQNGAEQNGAEQNGAEQNGAEQNSADETAEKVPPVRTGGFHVHAVPIDQPVGDNPSPKDRPPACVAGAGDGARLAGALGGDGGRAGVDERRQAPARPVGELHLHRRVGPLAEQRCTSDRTGPSPVWAR